MNDIDYKQATCPHKARKSVSFHSGKRFSKCTKCGRLIRKYNCKTKRSFPGPTDHISTNIAFLMILVVITLVTVTSIVRPAFSHEPTIISPLPNDWSSSFHEPTAKPSPTPEPKTEREIVESYEHSDIVWKVYQLESGRGKYDGCRDSGKFNGFGFMQHERNWRCFDSFESVVKQVSRWFEVRLSEHTLKESLCYYNRGILTEDCKYAETFDFIDK